MDFGFIIPTTTEVPMCKQVIEHWRDLLRQFGDDPLGENPQFMKFPDQPVNPDTLLKPIWNEEQKMTYSSFYFSLGVQNGIRLYLDSTQNYINDFTFQDFIEVVQNIGNNQKKEFEAIAKYWFEIGYSFHITSHSSSRGEYELRLMKTLASAIAKLTNGYILFENSYQAYNFKGGIYSPEEILKAPPSNPKLFKS